MVFLEFNQTFFFGYVEELEDFQKKVRNLISYLKSDEKTSNF